MHLFTKGPMVLTVVIMLLLLLLLHPSDFTNVLTCSRCLSSTPSPFLPTPPLPPTPPPLSVHLPCSCDRMPPLDLPWLTLAEEPWP